MKVIITEWKYERKRYLNRKWICYSLYKDIRFEDSKS